MATEKFSNLESIHNVKTIFNSIYFHQYRIDDTPELLEWLSKLIYPQKSLVFFREPNEPSLATLTTTSATNSVKGKIAMVTVYSSESQKNQHISTETLLDFYYSPDQKDLRLFFENNTYINFTSYLDHRNFSGATLFNLIPANIPVDDKIILTFEQVSIIQKRINKKRSLNNFAKCQKACVRTGSVKFSDIKSIKLNQGICLIHTVSDQFVIVSAKQLCDLGKYPLLFKKEIFSEIERELTNLEEEMVALKKIQGFLDTQSSKDSIKKNYIITDENSDRNRKNSLVIELLEKIYPDTLTNDATLGEIVTKRIKKWVMDIKKAKEVLTEIKKGNLVQQNWSTVLSDVESPSVKAVMQKWDDPVPASNPFCNIKQISDSNYFHGYMGNNFDDRTLEWVVRLVSPARVLFFFRCLSINSQSKHPATIHSSKFIRIQTKITFVCIFSENQLTIKKDIVSFSYPLGKNNFQLIFQNSNVKQEGFFSTLDEFVKRSALLFRKELQAFKKRNPEGKIIPLLNWIPNGEMGEQPKLSTEDLSAIQRFINDNRLLENPKACKEAAINNSCEFTPSLIKSINCHDKTGLCLIQMSDDQFIIVSAKQLVTLHKYVLEEKEDQIFNPSLIEEKKMTIKEEMDQLAKETHADMIEKINQLEQETAILQKIKFKTMKALNGEPGTYTKLAFQRSVENMSYMGEAFLIQLLDKLYPNKLKKKTHHPDPNIKKKTHRKAANTLLSLLKGIEDTKNVLKKIKNGFHSVEQNWYASAPSSHLYMNISPVVQKVIEKYGDPSCNITQIFNSSYLHTYMNWTDVNSILEWLRSLISPQTCLILLHCSAQPTLRAPTTISGTGLVKDKIFCIISLKEQENIKTAIYFSYPVEKNKFKLYFFNNDGKADAFSTLDDFVQNPKFILSIKELNTIKEQYPESKIAFLINLISAETINNTSPKLLPDNLGIIQQSINNQNLLNNPEAREKATIRNWEKHEFSSIESIHLHGKTGLCLIQTVSGQFAMLSAEQLIALYDYSFQEAKVEEITQSSSVPSPSPLAEKEQLKQEKAILKQLPLAAADAETKKLVKKSVFEQIKGTPPCKVRKIILTICTENTLKTNEVHQELQVSLENFPKDEIFSAGTAEIIQSSIVPSPLPLVEKETTIEEEINQLKQEEAILKELLTKKPEIIHSPIHFFPSVNEEMITLCGKRVGKDSNTLEEHREIIKPRV